jgi:hypothetical protein
MSPGGGRRAVRSVEGVRRPTKDQSSISLNSTSLFERSRPQ